VQLINWLLATDGEGTTVVNLLMNSVHSSKRAQGSRGKMVPMSIKQQTEKWQNRFRTAQICHNI
jgi:hypothetical protein